MTQIMGRDQSISPLHSRRRRPLLHDTERKDSQPRSLTRVLFCLCFGTSEANQTQPSSPGPSSDLLKREASGAQRNRILILKGVG